jgi:hypothetical protein
MSQLATRLFTATLLGGLLWSAPAAAELQESPQHFAFELKFGPYVPHLDDAAWLNGRTPFSDHFGDAGDVKGSLPPRVLLTMAELDYQFWNKFGILSIGLEGGYFQNETAAFTLHTVTSGGVTTQQTCQVSANPDGTRNYSYGGVTRNYFQDCISGDSDYLRVVPLALMLIYRFDVLDKRLRVPIIPYMKVGFAYYIWWFGNSNSFTAQMADGQGGKSATIGGSMGVVLHPGLSIDLSALDPRAARSIDQELGLNRVAAFAELNAALVNGFGRDRVMNLSDTSFTAGLSFEF